MNTQTYSETQTNEKFDWRKALANPDAYEDGYLSDLAGSWVTCAVGNLCDIIPRAAVTDYSCDGKFEGEPLDNELAELGMEFNDAVYVKDWDSAKELLTKIEARSQIVIDEEIRKHVSTYAEGGSDKPE